MGTIFEELVRRFNEANNEEAGEHWTPRDVVELMADLVFAPIADQIKDGLRMKQSIVRDRNTPSAIVACGFPSRSVIVPVADVAFEQGRNLTKEWAR